MIAVCRRAAPYKIHAVETPDQKTLRTLCGRSYYPERGVYPIVDMRAEKVTCQFCLRRMHRRAHAARKAAVKP